MTKAMNNWKNETSERLYEITSAKTIDKDTEQAAELAIVDTICALHAMGVIDNAQLNQLVSSTKSALRSNVER